MGNKSTSPRAVVDERYTRPQGLYEHKEGDYRKLRRLILNGQLAPCFPGAEECTFELDECPICFLFYPSLNRSRCCSKAICTECYLQIKSLHFARYTHCPFCKTSSYMVEYRGAKTLEEKGLEQAEEQKVIEAKIRIRQKEIREEKERLLRRGEDTQAELDLVSAREQGLHLFNAPNSDIQHLQIGQPEEPFERETNQMLVDPGSEGEPGMSAHAAHVQGSFHCSNRNDGFDLDMEEIMFMEGIWLSIQEQGQTHQEFTVAQQIPTSNGLSEDETRSMTGGRSVIAGGLAGAFAALAERGAITAENRMGSQVVNSSQQLLESANHTDMTSLRYKDLERRSCTFDSSQWVPSADRAIKLEKQEAPWEKSYSGELKRQKKSCGSEELNGWMDVSEESGRDVLSLLRREHRDSLADLMLDQSSEAVEVGTSFSFGIRSASDVPCESPNFPPTHNTDDFDETCLSSTSTPMLLESFEEQIMLAMALSLVEAQAQERRS